jgi:hypothetical protein
MKEIESNAELNDLSLEEVASGMDKSGGEQVYRNRNGVVTGTVRNGQRFDRFGNFRGSIG